MKFLPYRYGPRTLNCKFWLVILSVFLFSATLARTEPVRVIAFGDSLVHGYGLPPGDGFVPQMQRWLNDQGAKVVLVNAGVSGDTTTGGRQRLNWTLDAETDALIVALGGNDVLRGIPPDIARDNLDHILATATARGLPVLLVGITVPPNYGAAYQRDFKAIYPDLAETHATLLYDNFLSALSSMEDRAATLARYFQPDGLHPNRDGVALIVEDMGPALMELIGRVEQP